MLDKPRDANEAPDLDAFAPADPLAPPPPEGLAAETHQDAPLGQGTLPGMDAPEAPPPEPEPAPPRPGVIYEGDQRGTRTHVLLYPVRFDGDATWLRRIKVCPPSLWDVQDFAAGRIRSNYDLMARMTGIDAVRLGALKWPDIDALLDMTMDLLPDFIRQAIELVERETAKGGE